ncbi:ribonuclease H-like domain-containing protein [Mycena vulgaris]|nr:ribonuclease H-like domain-containing protein [Mycena vulgaris]
MSLPEYEPKSLFLLIWTEEEANTRLKTVTRGKIGFDTEFFPRRVPEEEKALVDAAVEKRGTRIRCQIAKVHDRELPFIADWDGCGLRLIQIAVGGIVYLLDMERIACIPVELARILASPRIKKGGVGLMNDGKVLWEGAGIDIKGFVDVGLMLKLVNPLAYTDVGNLALDTCVADTLGFALDKTSQKGLRWTGELTDEHLIYAALDARASLEVYEEVAERLRASELRMPQLLPDDWYTFDFLDGAATRIELSFRGERLPWTSMLCPWYQKGRFQGHLM